MTQTIFKMQNAVQNYAWGSTTFLAELQGRTASPNHPEAELWMGAHPKAPSSLLIDGKTLCLRKLIEESPQQILGKEVAATFGQLPFLMKILAANKPLSIQAHPNLEQAHRGFEKEEAQGIPRGAQNRNYRDKNHKPELICALTPFQAMRGFRPFHEISSYFRPHIKGMLFTCFQHIEAATLQNNEQKLIKSFFETLMTLQTHEKEKLISAFQQTHTNTSPQSSETKIFWSLCDDYQQDIGVLAPFFLNVVELAPGEAMFLGPGELHAYVKGVGIEIMANSDNVLRGGCTKKHIDIEELLSVLQFQANPIERLTSKNREFHTYPSPVKEFSLLRAFITQQTPFQRNEVDSAEIILCLEGSCFVGDGKSGFELQPGESAFVFASCHSYQVQGNATIFIASTPYLK